MATDAAPTCKPAKVSVSFTIQPRHSEWQRLVQVMGQFKTHVTVPKLISAIQIVFMVAEVHHVATFGRPWSPTVKVPRPVDGCAPPADRCFRYSGFIWLADADPRAAGRCARNF